MASQAESFKPKGNRREGKSQLMMKEGIMQKVVGDFCPSPYTSINVYKDVVQMIGALILPLAF